MKIGLLGGTFNPIHIGHLILAEQALWRLKLDRVVFIPSYLPPHKTTEELADVDDRLRMVQLATEENPLFEVSEFEVDHQRTSYSIDTIHEFKRRYGDGVEVFFVVGSDSLKELFTWKQIDEIFTLSRFVIANRPGFPVENVPEKAQVVVINSLEISSSQIRSKLKRGESIRYLVPEKVREYIVARRLYVSGGQTV